MKRVLSLLLALSILALTTGCVGLGVHRSARPTGKGNLEVGFSVARPSWKGVIASTGALGGAEGFLRYGVSDWLDFEFSAGTSAVTPRLHASFIRSPNFNAAFSFGLGVGNFGLSVLDSEEIDDASGSLFVLVPDIALLTSFGSERNELTLGLKALGLAGAAAIGTQGSTGGLNDGGGAGIMGGAVVAYTHRGKRLIVTPELDLFAGWYLADVGVIILPSVSFALAK